MHVVKNIQIPFFFFLLLIYAFWKFLRLVNSVWDFLRLIFGPGIFWEEGGKRGFVGSPRDFFWRGVDFVPIQSSPSLEIFISWKTF